MIPDAVISIHMPGETGCVHTVRPAPPGGVEDYLIKPRSDVSRNPSRRSTSGTDPSSCRVLVTASLRSRLDRKIIRYALLIARMVSVAKPFPFKADGVEAVELRRESVRHHVRRDVHPGGGSPTHEGEGAHPGRIDGWPRGRRGSRAPRYGNGRRRSRHWP